MQEIFDIVGLRGIGIEIAKEVVLILILFCISELYLRRPKDRRTQLHARLKYSIRYKLLKTWNLILIWFFLTILLCVPSAYADQRGRALPGDRSSDSPTVEKAAGGKEDLTRNFAVVGFPTIAHSTDNDRLGIGFGEDLVTLLSKMDKTFAVERFQLNLVFTAAKVSCILKTAWSALVRATMNIRQLKQTMVDMPMWHPLETNGK